MKEIDLIRISRAQKGDKEAFEAWSKTIMVNCCKNILRKKKRLILIDQYEDGEYVERYKSVEENADIEKELEKLNFNQREAIKLKYYIGLDYETIAQITKTPIGTVKSRISNGLKVLKKVMGSYNRQ